MAVAAPFPGQAGEQQAYYALIGEQPGPDVWPLLSRTRRRTTSSGATSRGCRWRWRLFAMIAAGLFLQRMEVEAPLQAGCAASCRSWRRATCRKIHDSQLRRPHRRAGPRRQRRDRALHARARRQRSDIAGKDLNAILGPSGGSTFDLPSTDSAFGGPPPPAFAPPRRRRFRRAPPPPAPLPGFAPPPSPNFPPPQPFSAASLGLGGGSSGGGLGIAQLRPAAAAQAGSPGLAARRRPPFDDGRRGPDGHRLG